MTGIQKIKLLITILSHLNIYFDHFRRNDQNNLTNEDVYGIIQLLMYIEKQVRIL